MLKGGECGLVMNVLLLLCSFDLCFDVECLLCVFVLPLLNDVFHHGLMVGLLELQLCFESMNVLCGVSEHEFGDPLFGLSYAFVSGVKESVLFFGGQGVNVGLCEAA